MKSRIYFLIVFVGLVFVPAVLCNNGLNGQKQLSKRSALLHQNARKNLMKPNMDNNLNNDRKKRSSQDFGGQLQEMGMNVAGMAKEMANEGFAVKESRKKSINFFGQKMDGGYDVKAGMGDALNDPSPDDDDEKKRRKRAPIPCRKIGSQSDANADNGEEETADDTEGKKSGKKKNNRSKNKDNKRRKREAPSEDDINSKTMSNKDIDEKIGVLKKVTEAMTEVWQNIANTFQKIGQKFSSSNDVNSK